jgi:hypothetical protein
MNGNLMLMTAWTFGGGGGGDPVWRNLAGINSVIATLDAVAGISTPYTVTEMDLSGFVKF